MAKTRNVYTADDKKKIILDILSRRTTIQKVSKEKGVAPTLVSLWKKQADDAITARFQPQPRGRRKSAAPKVDTPKAPSPKAAETKAAIRALKAELRKARAKATRTETALKNAKAQIATLESGVNALAASMGCKLRKVAKKGRK